MRRDRLSLAQALQQEHLREDRDSLQENAERPKDLEQSKLVVCLLYTSDAADE